MAQFTNQAQLRYGNSVTNSNIAVGEILEVLSVTKTAVNNTYQPDGTVTYIVSIINSGATPISCLSLSDNLGAYAFGSGSLTPLTYLEGSVKYYVNGVQQAAPTITAGPPLTIGCLSVPANGTLMLIYETVTNAYAPLSVNANITNTVTVSSENISAITAQETVTVISAPALTITKSISPVPVTENGTLTYTFLIQNDGNVAADAASAIVVSDLFDPKLSNLTVTFNGTTLAENTDYTYDQATGEFATVAGQLTVPAATFSTMVATGEWLVTPGVSTLVITGTV